MIMKKGDNVRHKSGTGPVMTVREVAGADHDSCDEGNLVCQWYDDGEKRFVEDCFDPEVLVIHKGDPPMGIQLG